MITETKIIRTQTLDPWWNLAVEEYLLNGVREGECILYLWQNQNTVVIGKNQNPWAECRTELLEKEGGKLARRLSGGGAVFHDTGNLNFTFIVDRKEYDLSRQVGVILSAVKRLGVPGEMTGRNDLVADGRKFSGNAFCFRKNGAYHHGTVLISADFDKLSKYLQVPTDKMVSKGIQSVRSRVVNLQEFNPGISIDLMAGALEEAFREAYGKESVYLRDTGSMDQKVLKELCDKYSSWEWRYGEAPKFDMELNTRFAWGGITVGLKLESGRVAQAAVYSDALDEEFVGSLPELLQGCILRSGALADRVRSIRPLNEDQGTMIEDIAGWLESKELSW